MRIAISTLTTPEALKHCEAIEQQVWGLPERDLVPASQLIAAVHAGGMVAGAFDGEQLIGFVYGFIAHHPEWPAPFGLHSHMLAVSPQYRNQRIGQQLKWFQRRWCLERGLSWITWTFDPMQAKNARLNFSYLGVIARHYYVNTYGAMQGMLNEGLPSDRLLAEWRLDAPQVVALAAGAKPADGCPEAAVAVLRQTECGIAVTLDADAPHLKVMVPADIRALYRHSRDQALEHLLAVREVMQTYLSAGYTITGFWQNAYILAREPELTSTKDC
jgi:predicted GNAT superfamily acetyltransferase